MWKSLKRWPALVAVLIALGALAIALIFLPYGGRVTRADCERIKKGMTEAEVRAILGKPWADSLLDPDPPCDRALQEAEFLRATEAALVREPEARLHGCFFVGSNVVLFVALDRDHQVVYAEISDPNPLRSWLPGRVWRRLRARYGW